MWVGICDEGLGVCVCEREKGEENTYLGGGMCLSGSEGNLAVGGEHRTLAP